MKKVANFYHIIKGRVLSIRNRGSFDILIKGMTSCNISYTNTIGSIWKERLETDFLGSYCSKEED